MSGDFFLTQWAFLGMRWLYETLTNESIVLTVILSTLIIRCATVFGDIRVKQAAGMGVQRSKPEYDDVAALAKEHGVSLEAIRKELS